MFFIILPVAFGLRISTTKSDPCVAARQSYEAAHRYKGSSLHNRATLFSASFKGLIDCLTSQQGQIEKGAKQLESEVAVLAAGLCDELLTRAVYKKAFFDRDYEFITSFGISDFLQSAHDCIEESAVIGKAASLPELLQKKSDMTRKFKESYSLFVAIAASTWRNEELQKLEAKMIQDVETFQTGGSFLKDSVLAYKKRNPRKKKLSSSTEIPDLIEAYKVLQNGNESDPTILAFKRVAAKPFMKFYSKKHPKSEFTHKLDDHSLQILSSLSDDTIALIDESWNMRKQTIGEVITKVKEDYAKINSLKK